MRKILVSLLSLALGVPAAASAQSLDDLNIQLHGFATQAVLKTTENNWNTAGTHGGSAAWTEAVVNVSSVPAPGLRIAAQARYFVLGTIGNSITLDWAAADYKFSDTLGLRAGKVKTPAGMLNEAQDVDPGQQWVLMPQSIYAIASRNSTLSHFGGVAYGTLPLGAHAGRLDVRGWGGQRIINGNDGLYQALRDKGLSLPYGSTGPMYGATLKYRPSNTGFMLGASLDSEHTFGQITNGTLSGSFEPSHFYQPYLFAQYEHGKVMFGGEYTRQALNKIIAFNGVPPSVIPKDLCGFYAMSTYKVSKKITGGLYYSSAIDLKVATSSARYQKDWAISGRYDVNNFVYVKVEQHVMDGTLLGYSTQNNPTALVSGTLMTLGKLGVSF